MDTPILWCIYASPAVGSNLWMWVSKEPGSPFTTMKDSVRTFKTYAGAVRSMEKLKAIADHWKTVGQACEVYKFQG